MTVGEPPASSVRKSAVADRPQKSSDESRDDLAILKEAWPSFVERVGNRAVSVKSALRDSQPVAVDELHVTIGFDPEFAEEMENFKSPRIRMTLQHVLRDILKRDVDAVFEAVESLTPVLEENDSGGDESEAVYEVEVSENSAVVEESAENRRSRVEWQQNPMVQQVLDTFNGVIVDVR
jgi:hypothetical protein